MNFDHSLDPFLHLETWVNEAKEKGIVEPNAMALATVGPDGQPSNRVVLYKGLVRGGLSFYTNYKSRKSREIENDNKASLNFFWPTLTRQIRIEGDVFKLTREESEKYFSQRPRLSQLGAWASQQSEEIDSTEVLAQRLAEMEKKFDGQEVPCPPHWGGFHLIPRYFEFWIGHEGRLHERFCFEKQGNQWRRFMRFP